jgi:ABC-type transport system involved in multi-copper enzyme maturation permease subunit
LYGPIFLREWLPRPRRMRRTLTRAAYLALLWVISVTAWQVSIGWDRPVTLGNSARFGAVLFQLLTYWVALPLLLFFAALSAASAIALEKDRRTFVLLLITDLHSYEIVLGKLLASWLQITALVVAMVPVLALLTLLGGVSLGQVLQAALVLTATALAAASLGGVVALWRAQTFQTLALTVLFLVLYLCLVLALPGAAGWISRNVYPVPLQPGDWQTVQAWVGPFHALGSVLSGLAPETSLSPAYGFAAVMVLFTGLLNGWGILRLRVWNPSGEAIVRREPLDEEDLRKAELRHAGHGRVRRVWDNPVLWREVRTRAYGHRPLLVKIAYLVVLGFLVAYALAPVVTGERRTPFLFAQAADGLVPVGIVSLLLVTAQAVTAITSERDSGALDLLLVTDLTPKEFIFGKLGGIVFNTWVYLLPPFVLAGLFAVQGLLATPPRGHEELRAARNIEAGICVAGALAVLFAFVAVLGIHVALRTVNSRLAIGHALGTVFFLSAGTLVCTALILINRDRFESQWFSFILFAFLAIAGLWWVLNGDRPSTALTIGSWLCPPAVFYTVLNLVIARPGSQESADPVIPFVVIAGSFGFTVAAMLMPLLGEFDIALGRTHGPE